MLPMHTIAPGTGRKPEPSINLVLRTESPGAGEELLSARPNRTASDAH
jgi:hypothetical protein